MNYEKWREGTMKNNPEIQAAAERLEQLDKLSSISDRQIETLFDAGWTIEKLSQASVFDLEKLKGIGKSTARKIIDEAIALTTPEPEQEEKGEQVEEPEMSVRVKRIKELNQ